MLTKNHRAPSLFGILKLSISRSPKECQQTCPVVDLCKNQEGQGRLVGHPVDVANKGRDGSYPIATERQILEVNRQQYP